MSNAGRPTKFTEEVKAKLCEAVSKGAPYELACNYAGIDDKTFYLWKNLANNGDERYIDFFDKLKQIEGAAALRWLDRIEEASHEQWQASAWKLERRHHKHFSQNAALLEMNERLRKLEGNQNGQTSEQKTSREND